MDIVDVKSIVREMRWDWERDHLDEKQCPKCETICTMVKVSVQPKDPEGNLYISGDA